MADVRRPLRAVRRPEARRGSSTACKAPDGTYWALQRWQRLLPMRGIRAVPARAGRVRAASLALVGPLPVLEVSPNWTYGGSWQGLFGRLTYLGQPGLRVPHAVGAATAMPYARFFYVDTFNSAFGPGWKHDAGKVAHSRNGAFCYSFVPQWTPAGYPAHELRPPGKRQASSRHGDGPGRHPGAPVGGEPASAATTRKQDAVFNALFDKLVGPDDKVCVPER